MYCVVTKIKGMPALPMCWHIRVGGQLINAYLPVQCGTSTLLGEQAVINGNDRQK